MNLRRSCQVNQFFRDLICSERSFQAKEIFFRIPDPQFHQFFSFESCVLDITDFFVGSLVFYSQGVFSIMKNLRFFDH